MSNFSGCLEIKNLLLPHFHEQLLRTYSFLAPLKPSYLDPIIICYFHFLQRSKICLTENANRILEILEVSAEEAYAGLFSEGKSGRIEAIRFMQEVVIKDGQIV